VFENVAENDIVERPSRDVLLEDRAFDADAWMTLAQRNREGLRALDAGEVAEMTDERRRCQTFGRTELEA